MSSTLGGCSAEPALCLYAIVSTISGMIRVVYNYIQEFL